MPEEARDTICISTQVGCPVDCKFCMTALMGLERNLTAGEIVGQVLRLARDNRLSPPDRRVNVVMMGMGEPLLNLPNVIKATRLLTVESGVGLSPRRITLSASGIITRMEELGRETVRPWERLTFEYVLLKGVNDTDADARRLVRLLANLKCKLNLIALNPGPGIPFESPAPERVASFQAIVRRSLPCFLRKPRGRDIFAACGQLRRVTVPQ